jgi:uncharacterized protein
MNRLLFVLLCATANLLGFAGGAAADVRDNARLFSPETVTEARAIIKDIEAKFKHSVTVETFDSIPDDKKAAFEKARKSKTDAARFFQQWAIDRARASGAQGVFILISKTPGHVEVISDRRETKTHNFTAVDAQDLARQLVGDFREKKFDEGLLAALESVRTTMQAHQREVRQAPIAKPAANPEFRPEVKKEEGSPIMGTLCVIAGIVLIFWVVIGLIRAFTGAGRPPMAGAGYQNGPPGYAPMGGGGGGMFNNFLGGMFGAVAGNWMYHHFFGGGHHQAGGGWDSPAFGGDRSAGGDFGGNDGAGDWGGGASAGGDFGDDFGGGGDWSGGGGDWGGGGDFGGDTGGGGDF